MAKKVFIIIFMLISFNLFSQNNLFLYIPTDEEMQNLFELRSYLKDWDDNKIIVDDFSFEALFNDYLGKNTIHSLLFESFLRYTKNTGIQNRVLNYVRDNDINNNFTETLKKLYAARRVNQRVNGRNVIRYNYQNREYDESINLFFFNGISTFEGELSLLLFENDWGELTFSDGNDPDRSSFSLIYGGGTNSIVITFLKQTNIEEISIETIFRTAILERRYGSNWTRNDLPSEGILQSAGSDKIIAFFGTGAEPIESFNIHSGTFIVYLYNRETKTLYEVMYYMNFSPVNIHYSERYRIYNWLLFQLLFVFIN